jgi:hypothetical protein
MSGNHSRMYVTSTPLRPQEQKVRSRNLPAATATFALHTAIAGVLFYLAFSHHSGRLFIGLDGANMLTNVAFQYAWTTPAAGFFANPLQGLADIWFNFNAWLSPGYALPHMLLDDATVADPKYQAVVYAVHAILFFVAIVIALHSIGFGWLFAYIATWTTLLLIFPCFGVPTVYPILQLQPNITFTIAETFAIIATLAWLGRSDGASAAPIWRDAGLVALLVILSGHFLLISPTGIMLALPVFLFLTLGLLVGSATRRELSSKLAGIAIVAGVLLAAGFGEFLLGIFSFTAANFSAAHFENTRMTWYFVSILFHDGVHGAGGPLLATLGIAGTLHAAICADRRLAWIARFSLGYIAAIFAFGTMTANYDFWNGPSPLYYEFMLWPLYAAFATRAVVRVAQSHQGRLGGLLAPMRSPDCIVVNSPAGFVAVPCSILLAGTLISSPNHKRDYPYPPSEPPLIKTLKERAGLKIGSTVNGRAVLIQLQDERQPIGWGNIRTADWQREILTGNDFHLIGLWYHGIPTLDEYAPTMSPALFRTAVQLLARDEDRQRRNVLVLRQMSAQTLAVLGTRYVLTDAPAMAPLRLIAAEKIDDGQTIRLFEVPGAITDPVSPVSVSGAESFDASLAQISVPGFDPHQRAILMEHDLQQIDIGELTTATGANVRLARNGFDVEAFSKGRSLIVIPIEFSHCLSFDASQLQDQEPTLIRVNALETGILFAGKLKGKLSYFTGPFTAADCRLRDARDFSRLIGK